MIPAAIFGMCLMCSGHARPLTLSAAAEDAWYGFVAQTTQAPAAQTPQSSDSKPLPTRASHTKPNPPHHKKTQPDCSDAPVPLPVKPSADTQPPDSAVNPSTGNNATQMAVTQSDGSNPVSAAAVPAKPCPPRKKVVRNGGSNEPAIRITPVGGSDQSEQRRSIGELTAAAEQNLKNMDGLTLTPAQQEMMNQCRQYLQQSKAASLSDNLEQAQSLAQKAQLLSQELVKP